MLTVNNPDENILLIVLFDRFLVQFYSHKCEHLRLMWFSRLDFKMGKVVSPDLT